MTILKTGMEWAEAIGDQIMDPDGWRLGDGVFFHETPITLEEYRNRIRGCTMHMGYYDSTMKQLRKPAQWAVLNQVEIKDRDGWRGEGAPDWETPITENDFLRRMGKSSVLFLGGVPFDKVLAAYREVGEV
jgi:hypothetical protein